MMTETKLLIIKILNIVIPLAASFCAAYLITEQSRRNRVLEKVTERVREALSEEHTIYRRQEEEQLQRLEGNREKKKIMYRIDELLVQSGIRKRMPFFTTELYLAALIVISSVLFYAVIAATGEPIFGIISAVLFNMATYMALKVMKLRNQAKLDDEILQFANMLENYSRTTDDIVSIFGKIVYYCEEPLRSAVGECYAEIQSTGDVPTAFARLDAKIGHRKFSELLQNIEICSRHETNYEAVIKGNKRIIKDYLGEKAIRKQMANRARMQIACLLGIAAYVITLINDMIGGSILKQLQSNIGGKLILAYCSAVVLYSIWKCFVMGQEA